MKERALAVDLLRGLAIVGMVLSGYISRNPDLPAWLFHAQLPPPSFAFDPSVPGITWVDLVFPFFLFSMGAAFPFSIGRRLDRGAAAVQVAWTILRRGLLLAFFAIVLGNTNLWTLHEALQRPVAASLLTLVVWGAFFAMFIRLRNRSKRFVPDDHVVAVPVKKGVNVLAVKVLSGSNGWKFVCGKPTRAPRNKEAYTLVENEDWRKVVVPPCVKPGTVLDFSSLGFIDAPAGKYGRPMIREGHIVFENRPGKAVRFFGVNLSLSNCSAYVAASITWSRIAGF